MMIPAYYNTDIKSLSEKATKLLEHCEICPRKCGVNRLKGELGHCKTGKDAIINSYGPHFGEERELVGRNGSGTIFFSHCNLNCVFCQNYEISQLGQGSKVSSEELAKIMLKLQEMECHNINLVSPTHIVPQFLQALSIAKDQGLNLPIVYNSGGYDSVETLKLLDGVIDIYMPDAKYGDNKTGEKYSKIPDYFDINKQALKEMHRQVGDLIVHPVRNHTQDKKSSNLIKLQQYPREISNGVNKEGIAERGLLIRHLVLPNRIAGSFEVLKFIAEEISKKTYVNIMDQYHPCYRADDYKELSRRISPKEYQEVVDYAKSIGLHRN